MTSRKAAAEAGGPADQRQGRGDPELIRLASLQQAADDAYRPEAPPATRNTRCGPCSTTGYQSLSTQTTPA
jgi:hypothetical protein